jgi:hypothetical protein
MEKCQVEGCSREVSKSGHQLCLDHWKAERAGHVAKCERCGRWHENAGKRCKGCSNETAGEEESPSGFLSSTKIGDRLGISNVKVNLILAELGWIEKYVKGWVPTERGNALGANVREMRNGTPFVVWPPAILDNKVFRASIEEQTATKKIAGDYTKPAAPRKDDIRTKFPANFCTSDGHMVRSRAELLIDNWLYMQKIVHAYERRLPIEEECYCDFYLPGGKSVYIEYWGLEADPKYRERQAAKRSIYEKHNLRLIELGDAEIERLDDVLPRMLLKFGIEST